MPRLLQAALLTLITTAGSYAQETRGSIFGRVVDPQGSAVPGASIMVINVDTNTTVNLTTNSTGYYEADLLLPGTLHYVANFFETHPEADVVYGHRIMIDGADAEVGRWVLPRHDDDFLRWADFVPQETLFWRRRIWEKTGAALDESFHYALDWDLLLRFLEAGARFARLPRFLGAFRLHPEQKTSLQMFNLGVPEMNRLCLRTHGRTVPHRERYRNIIPYLCRHLCYHVLYRLGILRY